MNLNISYDPTQLLIQAKKSIEEEAKKTLFVQIKEFFGSKRVGRHIDPGSGNWIDTLTPGEGLRQIDDMITKAFCDDAFQKKLDAYFEENWQAIYRECMVRALQHKANGVTFNRVHDLTLNTPKEK